VLAPSSSHPPFARPSDEECAALGLAARYLMRAGTQAATRLLGRSRVDPEAELLASLADSLLQGAALCDGLIQQDSSRTEAPIHRRNRPG